jgi:predicted 3-demethylubiquinone-9 3-methyltransferase (glyoxalase superfamily)
MQPLLLTFLFACSGLALAPAIPAPPTPQDPMTATMSTAQKITTFLWFDDDAETAVHFYTSLFPDSKVLAETRWGDGGPVPKGTLMTARFRLAGQEFIALNGGPQFHFTEAISLMVDCKDQPEIDRLWAKLTADGGEESRCGWLKDKYGLSWQLVPGSLGAMLSDPAKGGRVGAALMQMKKIDIQTLQRAFDGK